MDNLVFTALVFTAWVWFKQDPRELNGNSEGWEKKEEKEGGRERKRQRKQGENTGTNKKKSESHSPRPTFFFSFFFLWTVSLPSVRLFATP